MESLQTQVATIVRTAHRDGLLMDEFMREVKRQFITAVLLSNRCNIGRTARELDMHRNSLNRAMKELKIDVVKKRPRGIIFTDRGKSYRKVDQTLDEIPRWQEIEAEVRRTGVSVAALKFGISKQRVSQILGQLREAKRENLVSA